MVYNTKLRQDSYRIFPLFWKIENLMKWLILNFSFNYLINFMKKVKLRYHFLMTTMCLIGSHLYVKITTLRLSIIYTKNPFVSFNKTFWRFPTLIFNFLWIRISNLSCLISKIPIPISNKNFQFKRSMNLTFKIKGFILLDNWIFQSLVISMFKVFN